MNALITGASGGIGLELTKKFAQEKVDLILVARDQKGLDQAARQLINEYHIKVTTIALDLSVRDAAEIVYTKVGEMGITVDYLVNNAGFGNFGLFTETDWKREEAMIELNMVALTHLCRLFIPDMIESKGGKVLNVASVAAFIPGPFMAIYYATKSYVLSFSLALNNELKGTGVTVTTLCPGPTFTNFEKAASAETSKLFKRKLASPQDVATCGYNAMMKGKSLAVQGFRNKLMVFFIWLTPRSLAVHLSRKALTD